MAEMGKYCKAYLVKDLRGFTSWREDASALQPADGDGATDAPVPRDHLEEDDVLYLQENYAVTDGIFKDEHVVFSDITDEWIAFCRDTLKFQVPDWAAEQQAE